MANLNLQTLLKNESLGTIIEKINENFNQIATGGGGPQGIKGNQGIPGLPGLRGEAGPGGNNGDDGIKITLIPEDDNWGVLYEGLSTGPTNANAAIDEGFNTNDIWIDNNTGIFYVIKETSPGNFEFIPYPLSASVLANDFWAADKELSSNNIKDNGIRNQNKFITLSLTSIGDSSTPSGTQIFNNNNTDFQEIYGFKRSTFKLSIDNVQDGTEYQRFTEYFDDNTQIGIHSLQGTELSPLLYLGKNKNPDISSFGILLSSRTNNGTSFKEMIISGGDKLNHPSNLILDTSFVGTSGDHFYISNDTENGIRSYTSTIFDYGGDNINETSTWFSLSKLGDNNENISDQNSFQHISGLKLNKNGNNFEASIWTNDGLGNPNHVLRATSNERVVISDVETDNPGSKLSVKGNLSVGEQIYEIAAPTNGALIRGNVAIGDGVQSSPQYGDIQLHTYGGLVRFDIQEDENSFLIHGIANQENVLRINVDNKEVLFDEDSNDYNIGIGTNDLYTNTKLTIEQQQTIGSSGIVIRNGSSTRSGNMIRFIGNVTNNNWGLGLDDDDGFILKDNSNNRNRITVDQSGNTGIDTNNPSSKLVVDGVGNRNVSIGENISAPNRGLRVKGRSDLNEHRRLNTFVKTEFNVPLINTWKKLAVIAENDPNISGSPETDFPGLASDLIDNKLRMTLDIMLTTNAASTTTSLSKYERIVFLVTTDNEGRVETLTGADGNFGGVNTEIEATNDNGQIIINEGVLSNFNFRIRLFLKAYSGFLFANSLELQYRNTADQLNFRVGASLTYQVISDKGL